MRASLDASDAVEKSNERAENGEFAPRWETQEGCGLIVWEERPENASHPRVVRALPGCGDLRHKSFFLARHRADHKQCRDKQAGSADNQA